MIGSKLVVFYNGTTEEPDETVLNLSDAFRRTNGTMPTSRFVYG